MLTTRLIDAADNPIADLVWESATARHNLHAEGGWEIVTRADRRLLGLLEAQPDDEDYWVVMVDHSTGAIHGGVLWDWKWKGVGDSARLTLWGGNANWVINTTITLPSISVTNYPGTPARAEYAYTKPTQHASTSLYELVDDQINGTTLAYRNLDTSLTAASLTTTGRQLELESQPFEPLLDTVKAWSERGGLATDFQLRGATSTAEMLIRTPTARTFRLSEQDGVLVDWEYSRTGHKVLFPWMGGKGEGVDRQVFPVSPGLARPGINIERFIKASSADDDTAMIAAGQAAIEDNQASQGVKTKALASRMGVEYLVDYFLGDIVGVVFLGVEYKQFITGVETEWAVDGKTETIETGLPPIDILDIDITLGRQASVEYRPTAGLAIGNLRLADIYNTGDPSVSFAVELVYVEAEGTIADQAGITVEYRVDGGSWVAEIDDLKTGNVDYYYDLDTYTFTRTTPSFNTSLEYRASLAKTGETTVYSPVVVLAAFAAPVFAQSPTMSGSANEVGDTWTVVAGNAVGDPEPSYSYQWRLDGVAIVGETGASYTVRQADVGGQISVLITASNGISPDATTLVSNGIAVTDPNATDGFTTADDGYFTTADGGTFTTS